MRPNGDMSEALLVLLKATLTKMVLDRQIAN